MKNGPHHGFRPRSHMVATRRSSRGIRSSQSCVKKRVSGRRLPLQLLRVQQPNNNGRCTMQKDVSVTVTPGVGITIDPTTPLQLKKNQDSVQWKATTTDQQFTIVLPAGEPPVNCSFQGSKWVCVAGPFT